MFYGVSQRFTTFFIFILVEKDELYEDTALLPNLVPTWFPVIPQLSRHENNSVWFRRQFKWILGSSNYAVQKSRKMIYTVEASLSFSGEFST